MRRALGLGNPPIAPQYGYQASRLTDRHAQKRRFAADGDVPVVMLGRRDQGKGVPATPAASPSINRLREVEVALEAEQEARRRSERSLAEARATIHDLQTKIGHANLARDEAVEVACSLRSDKAALTAALDRERDGRRQGGAPLQPASEGDTARGAGSEEMKVPVAASVVTPVKRRGRPLGSVNGIRKPRATEPKPVRWW
jgi:hypothetical protein